jgi:hypothetical protein
MGDEEEGEEEQQGEEGQGQGQWGAAEGYDERDLPSLRAVLLNNNHAFVGELGDAALAERMDNIRRVFDKDYVTGLVLRSPQLLRVEPWELRQALEERRLQLESLVPTCSATRIISKVRAVPCRARMCARPVPGG